MIVTLLYIVPNVGVSANQNVYDSSQDSRIRLFGQNGKPTVMRSDINCETRAKGTKINVGGGASDAFKSFTGTASNQSIGIPETYASQNLKSMNGILSKAFFKEFVIKAGEPVNVTGALIGTSVETPSQIMFVKGCSSTVAFVPQAGRDYEVLGNQTNRQCDILIKEIVVKNGQTSYQDVPLMEEFKCKK